MAGQWPIFLTAPNASAKAVNRALLLMQDFQFQPYPENPSTWTLLTSKESPARTPLVIPPAGLGATDDCKISDDENAFAGLSLAAVNTFMRAEESEMRFKSAGLRTRVWVVLDAQGLESATCVVCQQMYAGAEEEEEDNPGGGELTGEFRALRCPWEEAHLIYANLDIENLAFGAYVDREAGVRKDGAWRWRAFPGDNTVDEVVERREVAVRDLVDRGLG
ncbi:hypothetical protein C8J57DRAFT_1366971 [Mycena rebaudengoi]|nr:hypothetical protein C8J57DRAFT_1366971 [Mycena rebaudengoi]